MEISFIQQWMVDLFIRWTMPRQIKVDNGYPFGNGGSDLPTQLSVWLMSLGIEVVWNPPRRPQANGVVENIQGLSERWAEPSGYVSAQEIQPKLEWVSHFQREIFKPVALGGKTRLEAFPELLGKPRPYTGEINTELIYKYLRKCHFRRKVSKKGQIRLMNRRVSIGQKNKGENVSIELDPIDHIWKVYSQHGKLLSQFEEKNVTVENINNLDFPYNEARARLRDKKT